MKKFFSIAAVAAAVLASFTLSAKEQNNKTPFHTNGVFDNTFVSVRGGANSVLDNGTFRIGGPAVAIEAGKWLTPYTAIRAGWQGITNRTADSANGWFSGDNAFAFNTAYTDIMFDAANILAGYRDGRSVTVSPFARAGLILTSYGERSDSELGAGGGIDLSVRITRRLAVSAGIAALWAREEAWRDAGKFICFPSATAGLTVCLGKTGFERHTDTVREVVREVPVDCDHEAIIKALRDEIAALRNRKADTVAVREALITEMNVYFTIDKWDISVRENWHLKDLVDILPADATLTIVGHADKETGSHSRNAFLAEHRVKAVEATLRSLGFKGTIKADHKGDTANPFAEPFQKNRCVTIKVTL